MCAGDVQTGSSTLSVAEAEGVVTTHPSMQAGARQLSHAAAQTRHVQGLGNMDAGLPSMDRAHTVDASHPAEQGRLGDAANVEAVEQGMGILALEDSAQPVEAGVVQPSGSVRRDAAGLPPLPACEPRIALGQPAVGQPHPAKAKPSRGSATQQQPLTAAAEDEELPRTVPHGTATAGGEDSAQAQTVKGEGVSGDPAPAAGHAASPPAAEVYAAATHARPLQKAGPNPSLLQPQGAPSQELLDAAEAPPGPVPARPAPFRRALASLRRPSRLRRAHVEHAPATELGHTGALPSEAVADSPPGSLPASLVPGDTSSPNPSIYRAAPELSRVEAEELAPPGKSTPAFMRAAPALAPPLPADQPQQPRPAAPEHPEVSGAFGSPIFRTVPGPDDTAAGPGAGDTQQGLSETLTAQGAACLHRQQSPCISPLLRFVMYLSLLSFFRDGLIASAEARALNLHVQMPRRTTSRRHSGRRQPLLRRQM